MRNIFKRIRGAKVPTHPAHFFKKTDLFSDLIEAVQYLNPTASEEEVFFMATTTVLAITDVDVLQKVVATANKEAQKKFDELSVLEDMFNSPATTTNNN